METTYGWDYSYPWYGHPDDTYNLTSRQHGQSLCNPQDESKSQFTSTSTENICTFVH